MQSSLSGHLPGRDVSQVSLCQTFLQDVGTHRCGYVCRWSRRPLRADAGRAAASYLGACFGDPDLVNLQFQSWKYRCSRLACQFPIASYIARRFLRESPVICHVNTRTGKRMSRDLDRPFVPWLRSPQASANHMLMQVQAIQHSMFVAMEVPLHSALLTGHLDLLLCDDTRNILYAIEVKSYPSDPTDPWAGTSRWALNRNLVQTLGYCELLANNTGWDRIGAGLLHSQGMLLLDASSWLKGPRTLLDRLCRDDITTVRRRTSQPDSSGP